MSPPPPQPNHSRCTKGTTARSDIEQWCVAYAVENILFDHIPILGHLCDCAAFVDRCESGWKDDIASKKKPGKERGIDIVHARDVVEAEEHVDVASSTCGALYQVRPGNNIS